MVLEDLILKYRIIPIIIEIYILNTDGIHLYDCLGDDE